MVIFRMMLLAVSLLTLWVYPALAAGNETRLEIKVDHKSQPVVGEMIKVTLSGFYAEKIRLHSLKLPRVEAYDWIQILKEIWKNDALGNGILYRELALFPKRAGPLKIGPFVHHLTVNGPNGELIEKEVIAKAIEIEIAPFPGDASWPLAARAVEYTDEWNKNPASLPDGETVTRTVKLTVLGVLPESLPPQPAMDTPWLITFSPPEKRTFKMTPAGPLSTVVWRWELRPRTGEPGILDEILIPWFNTNSRKLQNIVLQGKPIGYASFGINQNSLSVGGNGNLGYFILFGLVGFCLSTVLLFQRLQLELNSRIRSLGRWIGLHILRFKMRRAAKRGDLGELWITTNAYLDELKRSQTEDEVAAIDKLNKQLFSLKGNDAAFDDDEFLINFLIAPTVLHSLVLGRKDEQQSGAQQPK